MAQFGKEQIENKSLTGASFNANLSFYDEMVNYSIGEIVYWNLNTYTANTNIIGGAEGDLTNAPNLSVNWDLNESVMYNITNSVSQTFTNTRIDILLDTVLNASSYFTLNSLTGEVTCTKAGDYLVAVSVNIGIGNTSTSRSGSNTFTLIDKDDGNGYTDLLKVNGYHREEPIDADTGANFLVVSLDVGYKLKTQTIRYNGGALLETEVQGIKMLILNVGSVGGKGEKGDQGIQGVTGASGDLNLQGTWSGTFNSGLGYDENMVVEYNGSAFYSIVNSNTNNPGTPAVPNAGWILLCSKGQDGAGSSIIFQKNGVALPNSPHQTVNFIGDVTVTDAGGGVAEVTIPNRPIYVRYGKSNTQVVTATEALIEFDDDLRIHPDITKNIAGTRFTANRDINLDINYSINQLSGADDNARNTIIVYIKVNGVRLNYTQGSAYNRGVNYHKNATANGSGIYLELNSGDYIEVFFISDDDIQSPDIGNSETWITMKEV